jgi:putative ABC transport system permease protein
MFRNYLKIAIRNLLKQKGISFINIFGLSVGMAVTMLIGLWVWDELTYNKNFENYDHISSLYVRGVDKNTKEAWSGSSMPIPMADALRTSFSDDFTYIVRSSNCQQTVSASDKLFNQKGVCIDPQGPDMFSLYMLAGSRDGLKDPGAIMLSATLAHKLFGNGDAVGQVLKLNNMFTAKVSGVYKDLPVNSDGADFTFMLPFAYFTNYGWVKQGIDNWNMNFIGILVQLAPHADPAKVNAKIASLLTKHRTQSSAEETVMLFPMSRWHLYGEFKNGYSVGGLITFIWLFGIIGLFVLLLACINFMNLSTARSEKRAKEVGIRKAIGSERRQLVRQFFSESVLITMLALVIAIVFVQIALPWFNQVAGKQVKFPWSNGWYWLAVVVFSLLTGLIAGSYPAIYLSSFQPIKVLKGTFRVGRLAALPRKVLVVVQFSVSVLLITGTLIVLSQIRYAKDRPVGYDRKGLVYFQETTPEIYQHYDVIRSELIRKGIALEMSESQCPITDIWAGEDGFTWEGMTPGRAANFAYVGVRHEFGKTLNWKVLEGRDFSKAFPTDSDGIVLNESAVKYMGIKDPVGKIIRWKGKSLTVLGVTKDLIMISPYDPIPPTIFYILHEGGNFINIRLNPRLSAADALAQIEPIWKQYNPAAPFDYTFADEAYNKKFNVEQQIASLAGFFAILAVLISCLGLFGLASFVTEQRTKEIGIRKVLGAQVFSLWRMLSKDFVILVLISCCIASPVAAYFLQQWLKKYEYHTPISWTIFAISIIGSLLVTLMTVSYQAIKAALMNPVKSLKSE